MVFNSLIAATAAASFLTPIVSAFNPNAMTNVVTYYGQGSNQKRLAHFCQETSLDIINLGFLNIFPDQGLNGWPGTNFGNQCGSETFVINGNDTQLLSNCHQLVEDIPICQAAGKKVFLSLGGETPDTQKIKDEQSAKTFANFIWYAFGPPTEQWAKIDGPRPFKDVTLDGFDFDIEHNGGYGYAIMVNELRQRFAEVPNRKFYISAAPQCKIPDEQLDAAIANAVFDFIWVQFYNNPGCSARDFVLGTGFNFDRWAMKIRNSANSNAKLFVGLPGDFKSGGLGFYVSPKEAEPLIAEYMSLYQDIWGGIMVWDATASENNQNEVGTFADNMKAIMCSFVGCSTPTPTPTPSSSSHPSTTPTSSSHSVTPTTSGSATPSSSATPSASASTTSNSAVPSSTTPSLTPSSSATPSASSRSAKPSSTALPSTPSSSATPSASPSTTSSSAKPSSTVPSSTASPSGSPSSSKPGSVPSSSKPTGSATPSSSPSFKPPGSGKPSSSVAPSTTPSSKPAGSKTPSGTQTPSVSPTGSGVPGSSTPVSSTPGHTSSRSLITPGTTSSFSMGHSSSAISSGASSAPKPPVTGSGSSIPNTPGATPTGTTGSESSIVTSGITSAPSSATASSSAPETITTVIVTSYTSVCPTGFTTITTTYTTTYCPATASATPTDTNGLTGSGPQPTSPPEGWTTTVTVCTQCAATPTTVTLTIPCETETSTGSQPTGNQPGDSQPTGNQPAGPQPSGSQPEGSQPTGSPGTQPAGPPASNPEGPGQGGSGAQPTTTKIVVPVPSSSHPASSSGVGAYRPSNTPSRTLSVQPSVAPTAPRNSQGGIPPVSTGGATRTGLQSVTVCLAIFLAAVMV